MSSSNQTILPSLVYGWDQCRDWETFGSILWRDSFQDEPGWTVLMINANVSNEKDGLNKRILKVPLPTDKTLKR